MSSIDFSANFGDLKITQRMSVTSDKPRLSGVFHRLTSEQFDALTAAFEVTDEIQTLTTDDNYGPPLTFRTTSILFGGLDLTLYANVQALTVDPNQLSLLDA